MADDNVNQKDDTQPQSRGGRWKTLIVIGVLMLGEGVGIFVLMRLVSPEPEAALAAEDAAIESDPFNLKDEVEMPLCEISAFNKKEGRLYVYNAQVSVLVGAEDRAAIERFANAREQSIKDRIQLVFRSADPKDLNDPALQTIKRQLLFELNNLLGGKELIREILIPKLLQSRTNL